MRFVFSMIFHFTFQSRGHCLQASDQFQGVQVMPSSYILPVHCSKKGESKKGAFCRWKALDI